MADQEDEPVADGTDQDDPAALQDDEIKYPPYVVTDEERRRWDVCLEVAEEFFKDVDPGERAAQVWSATRVLYKSDAQTGDESERDAA